MLFHGICLYVKLITYRQVAEVGRSFGVGLTTVAIKTEIVVRGRFAIVEQFDYHMFRLCLRCRGAGGSSAVDAFGIPVAPGCETNEQVSGSVGLVIDETLVRHGEHPLGHLLVRSEAGSHSVHAAVPLVGDLLTHQRVALSERRPPVAGKLPLQIFVARRALGEELFVAGAKLFLQGCIYAVVIVAD